MVNNHITSLFNSINHLHTLQIVLFNQIVLLTTITSIQLKVTRNVTKLVNPKTNTFCIGVKDNITTLLSHFHPSIEISLTKEITRHMNTDNSSLLGNAVKNQFNQSIILDCIHNLFKVIPPAFTNRRKQSFLGSTETTKLGIRSIRQLAGDAVHFGQTILGKRTGVAGNNRKGENQLAQLGVALLERQQFINHAKTLHHKTATVKLFLNFFQEIFWSTLKSAKNNLIIQIFFHQHHKLLLLVLL